MTALLFPPELFILVGINVFVALSLLTSLFDGSFPKALPYVYMLAALAGFGQIWVNYNFLSFLVDGRFWCSLPYLIVAVANTITLNVYVAVKKRLWSMASAFLGAVTIPVFFASFLSVSVYVNGLTVWMPPLPTLPLESIYAVLVTCTVILGLSVIASIRPETLRKAFDVHLNHQPIPTPHSTVLDPEGELTTNKEIQVKEVKNE